MSSSALPPPSNLPSWSRVSTLDRSRYPKPFLRDRVPLPPTGTTITTDAMMDFNTSVKFLEKVSGQHHAVCYDKSIKFLQQQHANTLMKLQEELDMLKRENKELQFKVILAHNSNSSNEISKSKPSFSQAAQNDIKTLLLQEEIKDLKRALKETSLKNTEMQQALFSQQSHTGSARERPSGDGSKIHRRKYSVSNLSTSLPLNATLNPLQVRDTVDEAPRSPTMSECELIIQRLHDVNYQQLAELSRLRTDFRNVSSSQNSTPEPFATKMYGQGELESFSDTRLPRIPVKPVTKKSIKSANSAEVNISLPALKNSITSNVAERHKRQHALQKQKNNKNYK